jgi:Uma2 family endonuclease
MAQPQLKFSAQDFLCWEVGQELRYEYIHGEVYAMSGGTIEHNSASGAVFATLRQHLKGSPCRVFVADMKVDVQVSNAFFYPDVVVTCSPGDLADPKALTIAEPRVIVEVLSPSTAAYDRGAKFGHYRQLPSLQEYMLVDTETQTIEVFRRNAARRWELYPSQGLGAAVELASLNWQGSVQDCLG